jgi:hypothetical protein
MDKDRGTMTNRFMMGCVLLGLTACGASHTLLSRPTPYARDPSACAPPLACEGSDRNALAVNLVHFRAEEARRAQTEGRAADCQSAARTAVAVARGLLATRAYDHRRGAPPVVIRTRWSGDLPERAALNLVARDANAAGLSYRACGGTLPIAITPKEQYALFGGSPENKEANRRFWTNVARSAAASSGGYGGDGSGESAGEPGGETVGEPEGQSAGSSESCKPPGAVVVQVGDCCRPITRRIPGEIKWVCCASREENGCS